MYNVYLQELVKMKESLRTQEERQESRQVVTEKYEQYRISYGKADKQIEYMGKTVDFLEVYNVVDWCRRC